MLTLKLKYLFLGSLSLSLFVGAQSHAAAVLDPATEPYFSIAPYTLSTTDVSSGTAKAYRPWFENGAWQGDIIEYSISTGGLLSTTVDFSVSPPTTSGSNWSARIQFNTNVAANPTTYWNTGRKIIFSEGSAQKAFRWDNLSGTQQTALGSSDILDYIRGDQSNETDKTDGILRQRFNLLGDIIHANPVYIAAPDTSFPATILGYDDFKNKNAPNGQADRAGRVYASSNDGMVHAFDAATGTEVWAYIPSMILNDLGKLAAIPFTHTYFVDGQLNEGDADFGATPKIDWHSLLVGGLGAGGKGLFALDVTNANLSSEIANADDDKKILWEIDGTDDDIGYIHGKAQVARLPGNKWRVVSGNGYGSTSGVAKLLIIDKDGKVTEALTDDSITSNGLSAPVLVDIDNDFDVDYAYAGDLQGNLWKFDFNQSTVKGTILFTTEANQPITTTPDVRRHPNGGRLVYFGTGSFLSETDVANTTMQSIYGIWDGAPSGNTLLTQTLGTEDFKYTSSGGTEVAITVRTSTDTVIDWSTHKGWQVELNISGERLVTAPIIRADRLQFVSHNPLAGLNDHGDAWLLELNYLNGGTGPGVFLDLNRDGNLDVDDKANSKIPVGLNLGNGSFSGPKIARVSNTRDTMYINGLYLPATTPKTVNTHFQGGHIDVDTDSPNGVSKATPASDSYCFENGDRAAAIPVDTDGNPVPPSTKSPVSRTGGKIVSWLDIDGLGKEVDGHVHEYDRDHNQVYVDYINIEPICEQTSPTTGDTNTRQDLARVTEVGIDYDTKFFAIVANADLSPGSTFQMGIKKWNVVVYQELVHRKLNEWIAAGSNTNGVNSFDKMMVDEDGNTLLYSINTIIAAGSGTGTMRNSFNDRSILDGGLLPTVYNCVTNNAEHNINNNTSSKNTGRWRGGSLVTQLIGVDEYLLDTGTVVEQQPTDLFRKRTIDGDDIWLKADNFLADGTTAGQDGLYETILYGGLHARYRENNDLSKDPIANKAFLYESALYWHYKGSCYGTANWSSDVTGAANSSSTTSLKDLVASLEYDLEASEVKLQEMKNAGETASKIAEQAELIKKLKAKIEEIRDALKSTSVANSGIPTPPTDVTPEVSPSLGPNFRTGRRTWIDLTP